MAEIPEHLAKVLADLEARKQSLRSRLQILDSAIEGIQSLGIAEEELSPEAAMLQLESLADVEKAILGEEGRTPAVPVRETASEVERPVFNGNLSVRNGNTHLPVRNGNGHPLPNVIYANGSVEGQTEKSPAERPRALKRPFPKTAPERRKAAHLNIYVNQNSDWASSQFVAPQSPRAVFRHRTGQRCPSCGSQDTRFSVTRGVADFFMFLFDYSIARCRNCNTRFRIWREREEDEQTAPPDLEAHPSTE